ncbi:MAG: hypothetical protein ACRD98_11810, partial [Nitrososphaera sp.]
ACWQVLEELKADRSKILVVFTKYDRLDSEETMKRIVDDLGVSNAIVVSRSGYGISKLKTALDRHSYIVSKSK